MPGKDREYDIHPDGEKLNHFSQGLLAPDEAAALEDHLAGCADCCQFLEATPHDSFVRQLRDARKVPSPETQDFAASCSLPADESLGDLADHPRYRVIRVLGRGGMGDVYLAEHRRMGRLVALKVINPRLLNHANALIRFQQEVQTAAKLDHANIVSAYDADQAGNLRFLVMEYVEGQNLADHLAETGPLRVAQACDIIRQAALGLQHAHERGMVHRDIKPHNLMLMPSGQVKVLDFGLARFATESTSSAIAEHGVTVASLTGAGAVMGTADYIAPEQARDAHLADGRSDIYSLGCTFYHLLAGQPPFPDGTAQEKLRLHTTDAPAQLRNVRPEIPEGLGRIVAKMMTKRPEDRYQSAADVVSALRPFAKPPARHRRGVAILAGLAVVLLAAIGVYFYPGARGEIVIESEIPDVVIVVRQNGAEICSVETNMRQPVRLDAGEYDLAPRDGADAFRLVPERVTVKPGQSVVATVLRRERPAPVLDPEPVKKPVENPFQVEGPGGYPAYNPEGTLLAGCSGRDIALFDAKTGERLRLLSGHEDRVRFVTFSPDGRLLASGSHDRTIRLWDVTTGKHIHTLKGHTKTILCVDFSPDSTKLASASDDGNVWLWNVAGGSLERELDRYKGTAFAVAFHPDGKHLASGAGDGDFRVRSIDGALVTQDRLPDATTVGVAFSPDGRWLALGTPRLAVGYDGKTFREIWREAAPAGGFLRFTPDSTQLLSTMIAQNPPKKLRPVVRLDAATGLRLGGFYLPPGQGIWVHPCLSPNGKILAAHYLGGSKVFTFDASTGAQRLSDAGPSVGDGYTFGVGKVDPPVLGIQYGTNLIEVHSISLEALTSWLRDLKGRGYWPVTVAAHPGPGEPRFSAVAVTNTYWFGWDFTCALEVSQTDPWIAKRTGHGYRPTIRTFYGMPESREIHISKAVPRGTWQGSRDFIEAKVKQERDAGLMASALSYSGTAGKEMWTVITTPGNSRFADLYFDLSAENLALIAGKQREHNRQMVHLSSYEHNGVVRFTAVTAENPKNFMDWEFRSNLTTAEYEAALVEHRKKGLCPHAIAPFDVEGSPRYTALWRRYRLVR